MTPELTLSRTLDPEHGPRHLKAGVDEMCYTMSEEQLFRVWTVIRFLGEIRETQDRIAQSEILTDAQILLTAFVLDLQPMLGHQTNGPELAINSTPTAKLDA